MPLTVLVVGMVVAAGGFIWTLVPSLTRRTPPPPPPPTPIPSAPGGYRVAGLQVPAPSSDGSVPIQDACPKCKSKNRNYFTVVYHELTDRLHVQCGNGVYNGCGAKWTELPGDAK